MSNARQQSGDSEKEGMPRIARTGLLPSNDRTRVGMALYGDLTFDARVQKEARTLADAGYDVTIFCLASSGRPSGLPDGVEVVVRRPPASAIIPGSSNPFLAAHSGSGDLVRGRIGWLAAYVRGLREWGRLVVGTGRSVDVWHAHDLTGLAAIAPYVRRTLPLIYDSHEVFVEGATVQRLPSVARRLLQAYERRLVGRTDAVITVSDEIADLIRQRYRPKRISVVQNCPPIWVRSASRPSLIRESAGVPGDAPLVLYHGGFAANRGIERLMEAMLVDGLADVHLVLMGYGPKAKDFRGMAASEGLAQRVHVLEPVAPSDLLSWVAGADVGAMPNPGATGNDLLSSPNKLFECIAAGVPVIVSDFPTLRRIVVENPGGPLGALCDPMSVPSIAAAIEAIVRLGPDQAEALRARCLRAATDRFNWEAEGRVLLSIYAEVTPPEKATLPALVPGG